MKFVDSALSKCIWMYEWCEIFFVEKNKKQKQKLKTTVIQEIAPETFKVQLFRSGPVY